jgi:hypothetical protein
MTCRYAYSDGTKEDEDYYAMKADKRREGLNGKQVAKKVLEYLENSLEIIDMDLKRYPEKTKELQTKRAWIEAMIFFINHNV